MMLPVIFYLILEWQMISFVAPLVVCVLHFTAICLMLWNLDSNQSLIPWSLRRFLGNLIIMLVECYTCLHSWEVSCPKKSYKFAHEIFVFNFYIKYIFSWNFMEILSSKKCSLNDVFYIFSKFIIYIISKHSFNI